MRVTATLLFLFVVSVHGPVAGDDDVGVGFDDADLSVGASTISPAELGSESSGMEDQAAVSEVNALPSCTSAPDGVECEPVTECLPSQNSPQGGALYVIGGGGAHNLGPCTPSSGPTITPAIVLRALRRIALPASDLVVQPPGGKTLVNFDTIFSTNARPFSRTVTLLGREVDIEIRPARFTWVHGDSTSQTTSNPGRAYQRGVPMDSYVTHRYVDADVIVHPRVDTIYSARFRVDGGSWEDVVGRVTISGSPSALRVVEARPALVGSDW
jgi:hypothetical protein